MILSAAEPSQPACLTVLKGWIDCSSYSYANNIGGVRVPSMTKGCEWDGWHAHTLEGFYDIIVVVAVGDATLGASQY